MGRKDSPLIIQRKRDMIAARIEGQASASSSALSAAFGLPVDEVRHFLRCKGVRDDG